MMPANAETPPIIAPKIKHMTNYSHTESSSVSEFQMVTVSSRTPNGVNKEIQN